MIAVVERRFLIRRQPRDPRQDVPGLDDYPWYVSEITFGDDRDDYGRMETHDAAIGLVGNMLARPHETCNHHVGRCNWGTLE